MAMKPRRKFLHLYSEEALCFSAFLLSLFIYFSAFNLSLSTLFRHTTFWFCLSNTLIFIIAAHSRAFSPPPTFNAAVSSVIIPTPPQNNFNSGNPTENQQQQIPLPTEISIPLELNNSRKSYSRSKSEKAMRRVAKETKIAMRRSKTMTRNDATSTRNEEEERKNELAEMSNEELHKRVEEFIERFNRQMRLQAIGDSNEE